MHKSSKCDIIKYVTRDLVYITLFGETNGAALLRLECTSHSSTRKYILETICIVGNFFSLFDVKISFNGPKLVYSASFEMNRQQT